MPTNLGLYCPWLQGVIKVTLAKKPDKHITTDKDLFLHTSVEERRKIKEHLAFKIGEPCLVTNCYTILEELVIYHHRFGAEPFFPLSELIEHSYLSPATVKRILALFIEKDIVKRATKFTSGSKQSKKAWYAIVDQKIINLFHLGEIMDNKKRSLMDEANGQEERTAEFYQGINKALKAGKYYWVCEEMDNINDLAKNVVFLFTQLYNKRNKPRQYTWEAKTLNHVLVVLRKHFPTKNTYGDFDYYWIKHFMDRFEDMDVSMGATHYFKEYLEKNIGKERDVPPKMSFVELYDEVMDKPFIDLSAPKDIDYDYEEEDPDFVAKNTRHG
jgi:hypothetical protein